MKKRVLINGRFTSHHFAIRNVIYNITKQISQRDDVETFIVLNRDSDISEFEKLPVNIIFNESPADSGIRNHLFTIFKLPFILLKKRIDIVIYPQICFFLYNPCKCILYMHDLIEYKLSSQKKQKMLFRKIAYPYICKRANRIVAVSENTKKDLHRILSVDTNKIAVAYDGADVNLKPLDKKEAKEFVKKRYGINNYLFYIGYLTHPQKNLIYLISEFEKINKRYPELELVFAGPKGKDAHLILEKAQSVNIKFHYLGKVPYEDLSSLYSACEVFCFPSLYEGFGMPVLEAMKCGAPVIASNTSSIPEILNDKRFLINPNKEGDLEKVFEDVMKLDLEEISHCNIKQSENFTWNKHGQIIYEILDSIM